MNSWKTTVLGVISGLLLILPEIRDLLTDPSMFDLDVVLGGLSAMGIGVFARDNSVSSERAGAK